MFMKCILIKIKFNIDRNNDEPYANIKIKKVNCHQLCIDCLSIIEK